RGPRGAAAGAVQRRDLLRGAGRTPRGRGAAAGRGRPRATAGVPRRGRRGAAALGPARDRRRPGLSTRFLPRPPRSGRGRGLHRRRATARAHVGEREDRSMTVLEQVTAPRVRRPEADASGRVLTVALTAVAYFMVTLDALVVVT